MPKKGDAVRGIKIVHPRSVPVIISLCRTAKIAEIVNRMVEWNEAEYQGVARHPDRSPGRLHHVRPEAALESGAVLG